MATCAQNSGIAEMRIAGANARRVQPGSIVQARANGRNRVENCKPIFSNRKTPLGGTALSERLEADDRAACLETERKPERN
jgi:hypothetical protein